MLDGAVLEQLLTRTRRLPPTLPTDYEPGKRQSSVSTFQVQWETSFGWHSWLYSERTKAARWSFLMNLILSTYTNIVENVKLNKLLLLQFGCENLMLDKENLRIKSADVAVGEIYRLKERKFMARQTNRRDT